MLHVVVGSASKIKVELVADAFAAILPAAVKFQVHAVKAPSGINDQPLGLDETAQGARNRLNYSIVHSLLANTPFEFPEPAQPPSFEAGTSTTGAADRETKESESAAAAAAVPMQRMQHMAGVYFVSMENGVLDTQIASQSSALGGSATPSSSSNSCILDCAWVIVRFFTFC